MCKLPVKYKINTTSNTKPSGENPINPTLE